MTTVHDPASAPKAAPRPTTDFTVEVPPAGRLRFRRYEPGQAPAELESRSGKGGGR